MRTIRESPDAPEMAMSEEEYSDMLATLLNEHLPLEFHAVVEESIMEWSTKDSRYEDMLEQAEVLAKVLVLAVKAYDAKWAKAAAVRVLVGGGE